MTSMEEALASVTDPTLRKHLASLGEKIAARERENPEPEPQQTARVIQLPLWSESKRGVPNSVLRGSLFSAIHSKDRRPMKGELLASQQGVEIRYTGWQLDQFDLDVWEQALHLARQHPLGSSCHFTAHSFLKSLGRSTGGEQHGLLKSSFDRQIASAVEIKHVATKLSYTGSLIVDAVRDEADHRDRYMLQINPKMAALYDAGWTAIDWGKRLKLKGKPLALWLHGFYSSHAAPYPLTVEYIHQICGSQTRSIRKFRQNLAQAHRELTRVEAIKGFEIKDNLVYVENMPSHSQQRHLAHPKKRDK